MAVKKGYKQTEVGVIPEDWEVKRLREISPSQSVGLVINPSTYYNSAGTVPLLVGSNVKENSIDWESANKITEEGNQQIPASQLFAGDLVMVRVGEPGVTAVVPKELEGANCASMMIIRRSQRFNSVWLCWILNSKLCRAQVENVQYGTAQKQFNISDAINFKVPVPTLAEQEAIAGALSDADAWIESLEQLIAKKRLVKQGAMQELLTGKRRLPGFSGEWETKRLGELGRCQRGVSYNPSLDLFTGDTNSTVRLLRSNNVQDARIVYSDIQFVASSRVSSEQYLRKNDILICMANGSRDLVGKAGRYCEEQESDYTFGAFMGAFRPASEMTAPVFSFYLFQTDAYRQHIAILLAGSSINNLTPDNLESHIVVLPNTIAEQTAIATVLSDMDAEIESLEVQLAKAREIKQGMMQELLTGRIRLVS